MHDMILGQPGFVAETLRRGKLREFESVVARARNLIVTGCGTSFHAATYGASVLQEARGTGGVVRAIHAYDLANGALPPPRSVVLGVSHSGSTPTTNRALGRARRAGLRTIGLCGLPYSEMEKETAHTWVIGSTHDHSWANTMSYTTQLTAFASLASRLGGAPWSRVLLATRSLPATLTKTLACENLIRHLAGVVAQSERVTFLGSDLDAITAKEAALKIRETCSLPASGYHLEQFLHGPCLSVDRHESVIVLRSQQDARRCEEIQQAMLTFGARVATVGDGTHVEISLPRVHRILRPIVSIVPMQFIAYYAALARGANPDIMRTDIPRYRAGLEPLFR